MKKKPFGNIVGKGENAGHQHFLLLPQCFLPFPKQISILPFLFLLSSANAFNLDQPKNISYGKQLKLLDVFLKSFDITTASINFILIVL